MTTGPDEGTYGPARQYEASSALLRLEVEVRRRLAAERPEAFMPELAASLRKLGAMQENVGQRSDALKATKEAVEIYRKLSVGEPNKYLPDLAASLYGMGNLLGRFDQIREADEATDEANNIVKNISRRANVFGSDSIIVHSMGSGINVVIQSETPYLRLTQFEPRTKLASREQSDAALLSPYRSDVVPLVGREREMAELRCWLEPRNHLGARPCWGRRTRQDAIGSGTGPDDQRGLGRRLCDQ